MGHMRLWTPNDFPSAREQAQVGEETWTPALVGHSFYVSNLGRLATVAGERTANIKPPYVERPSGYARIYVPGYGNAYVHWLVLATFEGPQPRRRVVRESPDRLDNRLSNLSWSITAGRLSPNEKELLMERLRTGIPQAVVAREFGLSVSHVGYYNRKLKAL